MIADTLRSLPDLLREYDLGKITIRQVSEICQRAKVNKGIEYVRMDMGVPGLPTPRVGQEAVRRAIEQNGLCSYQHFQGIEGLRDAGARFFNTFCNTDVDSSRIVVTNGAMHGGFVSLELLSKIEREEEVDEQKSVLLLQPGFSVNQMQAKRTGLKCVGVDLEDQESLLERIENAIWNNNVVAMMWSSPSNPTWQMLNEGQLEKIANLCEDHGVTPIEDFAYFGFDSRSPMLIPGESEVPTIQTYTDSAITLVSASKIFSYADGRVGFSIIGKELAKLQSENLGGVYGTDRFFNAFVQGGTYSTVASVSGPMQQGFTAMLDATLHGELQLKEYLSPYIHNARVMKSMFHEAGFEMLYDNDQMGKIGDGFYFTVAHPKFQNGSELLSSMLQSGLSGVPLVGFGGDRKEGMRICTSLVREDQYEALQERLGYFTEKFVV